MIEQYVERSGAGRLSVWVKWPDVGWMDGWMAMVRLETKQTRKTQTSKRTALDSQVEGIIFGNIKERQAQAPMAARWGRTGPPGGR